MSLVPRVWCKVKSWRDVTYRLFGHDNVCRHFTLECGHTVTAKGSAGYPNKKLCRECGLAKLK